MTNRAINSLSCWHGSPTSGYLELPRTKAPAGDTGMRTARRVSLRARTAVAIAILSLTATAAASN